MLRILNSPARTAVFFPTAIVARKCWFAFGKDCARAQLKAHEFSELFFGNLQTVLHVFDDDPA